MSLLLHRHGITGGTPGGGGSAHRYWRFQSLSSKLSTALTTGQIEAYENAAPSTDVLSSATLTADNEDFSSSVSSINDGNTSTWWGADQATNGYTQNIYADFGVSSSVAIEGIQVWARSGFVDQAPTIIVVSYSDDAVSYTDSFVFVNYWNSNTTPQEVTREAPISGKYQFFRWTTAANISDPTWLQMAEIEIRPTVSGSDGIPDMDASTSAGTAAYAGPVNGNPLEYAFRDDGASAVFQSAVSNLPLVAYIDARSQIAVSEVYIQCYLATTAPADFKLEGLEDDGTWTTIMNKTGITWAGGNLSSQTFTP